MQRPIANSQMSSTIRARDGREYIYFGGSSYLGLSCDESVLQTLSSALVRHGFGVGASRATSGETEAYLALEQALRSILNVPSATVAPSTAIASMIMMDLQQGQIRCAIADANIHPSLKAAIAAAGVPCHFYHSADPAHASELLARNDRPALLCTDGVNPVNGAIYPLAELHSLATAHGAIMLVDDAHGFGVLAAGLGSPAHCGLDLRRDGISYIASFSKAIGAIGGFLATPQFDDAECRSSVHFTTSTPFPPFIAEGIRAALKLAINSTERRERLTANLQRLRPRLQELGLQIPNTPMPLISFTLGSPSKNTTVYQALLKNGIYIPLIQYPSKTSDSVFRLALSALHTTTQLDHTASTLQQLI